MPDTSGPLPVVKFSYGHYNEQRRRIDRLVQGLPVLSASTTPNPNSAVERQSGTGGGAVVYVNGEEPVRHSGFGSAGSRERQSRSPGPGPGPDPRSASRSSSGELRHRSSRPAHPSRHKSVSPSPPRPLPHSSQPHGAGIHPASSSNKLSSSEIVVIEDEYQYGKTHHSIDYKATGFRPTNGFNGSHELRRSQSQKVQKARQKMMAGTRKSRDQNHHVTPTHVPVQSCWAMAELTW